MSSKDRPLLHTSRLATRLSLRCSLERFPRPPPKEHGPYRDHLASSQVRSRIPPFDGRTAADPGGNLRHTSSSSPLDAWISGATWVVSRVELLSSCAFVLGRACHGLRPSVCETPRPPQEADWEKDQAPKQPLGGGGHGARNRGTGTHGTPTSLKEGHRHFQRKRTTVGNRFRLSPLGVAPLR